MPSREWQLRIQDILISVNEILELTAGTKYQDFLANRVITKAVLYNFVIIGEATKNLPVEIRSRYPEIPWRLMGNMRLGHDSRIFPSGLRDNLDYYPR